MHQIDKYWLWLFLRKILNFQIEDAPGCGYDYVEVRDGGDETSTVLKKECGSLPPNTIQSTDNKMFVKFHSDTSDVGKGFSASFKTTITTAQPSTQGPTTQGPNNGCGGELNGESGQLKSPNFPNNYGNNQNCEWVINVPAGSSIILDFETPFDVSFFLVQKSNKNNFLSMSFWI